MSTPAFLPQRKATFASPSVERQRILQHLADNAAVIAWEMAPEGRFFYLSPGAADGADADALHVADWHALMHAEDSAQILRAIAEAKKQLREYQFEYRIVRSDASVRWITEIGAPRFSRDGRLLSYVGTFVDASGNQEARGRLARSEIEHRLLTENARDLIAHSDANNVYVYVSPSHKDTLGYEPHELVGTHLYDYIHPDDLQLDAARTKEGRRGMVNIRFRHKNGSWVWLGASTRTLRDPKTGNKLGMVAIARDITAQLEAERELRRREERFRSLTSLSSDWYWETDEQIRFTFFSEGLYARMLVRPEQLLGTTFADHSPDPQAAGLLTCVDSIAARQPFHDVIFPVASLHQPGSVRFLRISGEPFSENGVFCGYRGVSRDVTPEVRTAQALERLATRDVLTELPNRAVLQERLKERIEERAAQVPQGVFFIDLDDFKEVNDSLGHAAGDQLLKEIAARLNACVQADATVARLGGDEFVVLAECREGPASAARLATLLCEALDHPILIEGHEVKAAASIGISMFPQDGRTSDVLLQNADTALYRAKAAGGNTYSFFTRQMGEASRSRMTMQAALRHALERNELEVYYQPRVHLKSFEVAGVEALLRWEHPELGAVSPNEFIPLAEEIGLIDAIGEWVLQRAAAQAQAWSRQFGRALKVSVNLSARQIRKQTLLAAVTRALQDSGLAPAQLELELTESTLMEDVALAAELLAELKSLGLRLSVDDFGTGYSSLAYLSRFPFDSLKLDRSFLQLPAGESNTPWKLAEAVINLAATLNLSVIAEGVETEAQLAFLRTTVCDEIQGTCISEPLSRADAEQLLERGFGRK